MSEALVVQEPQALTVRGILTRDGLKEAAEQRKLLGEYVRGQMVKDVDFGTIPGTPKPTLLKPGAEKLVDLYRCTPKFKLVRVLEDYDNGLFAYTFRVQLYQRDAGVVLAEGYGSANSREGRYRWRQANRKCPKCGKETILASKFKDCAWFCFAKKGGCGAKFQAGAKDIESQTEGKVENDDVATLANTILKMAKKRALVDGAIALARVSDLFTQDVEDTGQAEEPTIPAEQTRVTIHDNDGEPPRDLEAELRASVKNGQAAGEPPTKADQEATPMPPSSPASSGKSAGALAHDLIAGIDNIKNAVHYGNWKQKHEADANSLPPPLKKAVWAAYEGAAKRFQP